MTGSFAWRYLTPVIAVAVIVVALGGLPDAWAVAHSDGTAGEFVVTNVECVDGFRTGKSCTSTGDFTAVDGAVRKSVRLNGYSGESSVGEVWDAIDLADPAVDGVFVRDDRGTDWKFYAAFIVAALIVLVVWAVALFMRLRKDDDEQGTEVLRA